MGSEIVILQTVLAILPYAQTGVEKLIGFVQAVRKAMQQSGEWTPQLETDYRAALWAKTGKKQYQPDPK
jgi:hypothetical protein